MKLTEARFSTLDEAIAANPAKNGLDVYRHPSRCYALTYPPSAYSPPPSAPSLAIAEYRIKKFTAWIDGEVKPFYCWVKTCQK